MIRRPYLASSIVDLEKLFEEKSDSSEILAKLIVELAHRARPRAQRLHQKVLRALSEKTPAARRKNSVPKEAQGLLSVEEHRRVAAYLRTKQVDWTPAEQKVALDFAKHHEFLADLIEKRSP